MNESPTRVKSTFGTAPVFLTAISTILGSSDRGFGYRREIHIWLTSSGYENAGLMILLAYVILGHPDWKEGVIKIFAIFPEEELETQEERLLALIKSGRLPISASNVEFLAQQPDNDRKAIINERASDADLTIIGFRGMALRRQREKMFEGYEQIGNVLFVGATHEIRLAEKGEDEVEAPAPEGRGDEPPPTPSSPSNTPAPTRG